MPGLPADQAFDRGRGGFPGHSAPRRSPCRRYPWKPFSGPSLVTLLFGPFLAVRRDGSRCPGCRPTRPLTAAVAGSRGHSALRRSPCRRYPWKPLSGRH